MTVDRSRRFTDKEVALVLRNASELEEAEGTGPGGGLSLQDLQQIATEVGISREVLDRAVAALDSKAGVNPFARGQLVHQVIRAVEGELSEKAVSELIQHVDGTSDQVGVVSEALGASAGALVGRFLWRHVSSASEARVKQLAADLTRQAEAAIESGKPEEPPV